jgi:hypothetical protein
MKSNAFRLALLLAPVILLSACRTSRAESTQQAIYTSAAQTLAAQLTLAAGETAVAQLTQIAQGPTDTPLPPTQPPPSPTVPPTSPPPTATAPPVRCDWAEYVQDVSVEDNTVFFPGGVFTKIWRVRNVGSCTWTPAYTLIFASGDPMGGPSAVFLSDDVRPGDTVDLPITLTAPDAAGVYRSSWLLRNPSGVLFGTGPQAQGPLTLQIQVAQPPTQGRGQYDFALSYCSAQWRSSTSFLPCPGSIDDQAGSVVLLGQPYLESRLENQPALWTRPDLAANGSILGQYPSYLVRSGDRFRAEVGCLFDSPGCDVYFTLDIQRQDGTIVNLGVWREVYDRLTTTINLDLSSLAGQPVQFLLGVQNLGDPQAANAFWLAPYIQNAAPATGVVLVWNQRGGSQYVCQELRISLDSLSQSTAQARSCRGADQDLGNGPLTQTEQDQLLAWVAQLAPFDAELFDAGDGEPLTSYLSFNGRGTSEAQNPQIMAMQEFAQQVFRRISR